MTKTTKQPRDLYQEITNQIVEALEQGVAPWACPWERVGAPRNANSQRPYNGINALILGLKGLMMGYSTQEWLTFNQAKALGGRVRKGEKGTVVIFYKKLVLKDTEAKADEGEESPLTIPLMRSFVVFNLDQIDGIERTAPAERPLPEGLDNDAADAIIAGSEAIIRHGGDEAFYSPSRDMIQMPSKEAFADGASYYATLFHELTHWTGSAKRLARPGITGRHAFGSPEYAFEELVAELGAAFLCAEAGIEGELRHEGYIQSWLEALRNDKKLIFRAASAAQKAADLLATPIRTEQMDKVA